MSENVNQLTEWLEANIGHTLSIRKEEYQVRHQGTMDVDQTEFHVDKIAIKEIERTDPDHYLANQEVILYGQGTLMTDTGAVEIPQNVYEIPIIGDFLIQNIEGGLKLETEKAVYTIKASK